MLTTTDAIVLSLQPQSDKAHVLHAYTRAGGRVNYRVYGLGRKNPRGLYSPFSLLQITTDQTPSKPPTLKEATPVSSQYRLTNVYKQTICLFISEVLYNVLRHPMQDEPMFDYLAGSIAALEEAQGEELSNFHLRFLIGFAAKLGFAIDGEECPDLLLLPHTRTERQKQLRALCAYFEEQVETWQNPRSLDILMEVFD